jgi:23S rRNA (guanosine2251-2'-O)-methyltransferase
MSRGPRPFPQGHRIEPPPPDLTGLLGPDEEIIAGRRPVEEAFVAGREAKRLIVVPQRRQALERLVLHATSLRIPIVEVEGGTLTALAGFDGHQGIAVVATPRRYATLDDVLARAIERGEAAFVLALDSLEDPQNVGTLLRSAEAAGIHGVLFPTHRQAPLTPAAIKASAGAVEHLLLCPVDDLAGALADLHVRGLRVVGAEAGAPLTARDADMRGPLAIVVGSEGQGLGPAIRSRCDVLVRIPLRGAIESLNAAVAGSILLFEADAQRHRSGSEAETSAANSAATSVAPPATSSTTPVTGPAGDTPPGTPPRKRRSKTAQVVSDDAPKPPEPAPDALLPGAPVSKDDAAPTRKQRAKRS